MENTIFRNNLAGYSGGAIFVSYLVSNVEMIVENNYDLAKRTSALGEAIIIFAFVFRAHSSTISVPFVLTTLYFGTKGGYYDTKEYKGNGTAH